MSSPLQISKDVLERQLGDRLVLLHLETGEYHNLNETALLVWTGIRDGRSLDQIVISLAAEFDVPADQLTADIATCVDQLLARRLLERQGL